MQARLIPLLLLCAAILPAHHSMTMYDRTRIAEYTGVVTKFEFSNPHIEVQMDVDKNGRRLKFLAEGGSPQAVKDLGWSHDALMPGEKIRLRFYPMKDGSENTGWVLNVTREDGTVIGVKVPRPDPVP